MSSGWAPILALFAIIAASVWLGTLAQRAIRRGSFLKGYFLGNRGLGAWALALTATVTSGGTFMGFPSLVYSHGWVVTLWIASYMIVPLSVFAIFGKRMAQISRRTGAITLPDFFRERFGSPAVGLTASIFLLVLLTVYMIPQFKAGAIIMQIAWPGSGALELAEPGRGAYGSAYHIGLVVFTLSVVGYTLIGGFLAAVWTDLFQSVLMLVGVVVLFVLTIPAAGGTEAATRTVMAQTGPAYAFGPGYAPDGRLFHPLGLAISVFFIWVFAGAGQPSGMVRVMACKEKGSLRKSIVLLNVYNVLIYIPLIMICICGRSLIPDLEKADEIIPRLAMKTTGSLPGGSLLAGLVLAAPFGAVMSTVSMYLIVIASGVVRDVYQRWIRPEATSREMRLLTYGVTVLVGLIAIAANIWPVRYLQALIVFGGTGAAATFLVPAAMACFWRRATAPGCLAAMFAGAGAFLALYIPGWLGLGPNIGQVTSFRPYYLLQLDPFIWALAASIVAGVVVSLVTRPPDETRVSALFDAPEPKP